MSHTRVKRSCILWISPATARTRHADKRRDVWVLGVARTRRGAESIARSHQRTGAVHPELWVVPDEDGQYLVLAPVFSQNRPKDKEQDMSDQHYPGPPDARTIPHGPPLLTLLDDDAEVEHGFWRLHDGAVAVRNRPIGSSAPWESCHWVVYDPDFISMLHTTMTRHSKGDR